ncbi:hypothetical protein IPF37_04130 [bacterium]|nr:MAG: hypothetical protein IPF37_04130 [bacterium]
MTMFRRATYLVALFTANVLYAKEEIKEVDIKIKGLVGSSYITGVINTVKNIKEVEKTALLELKEGLFRVNLKRGNNLSFEDIEQLLFRAVKKAGCACNLMHNITATGTIKENNQKLVFHIGTTNDTFYLEIDEHDQRLKEVVQEAFNDQVEIKITGRVYEKPGQVLVISKIQVSEK